MADLRIVDAPEIPTENITGEEKLPTGGNGNYSISLDSLADYTKTKKDLADNTSVDGKVNGVRQELSTHIEDLLNPHQVTKGQIGLGNVDNTADADKPVSNSTQAAIISAVAPKADKTYVDNQLTLKANKVDVYAKLETYTKQESNDLVNNSISTALTPVNTSLGLAKRGVLNRYDSSLTYNSGERVVLTNTDIVKSTIDGNTNDPNVNMTGWVKTNDASFIVDGNENQHEINTKTIRSLSSASELSSISAPSLGQTAYVKNDGHYGYLSTGWVKVYDTSSTSVLIDESSNETLDTLNDYVLRSIMELKEKIIDLENAAEDFGTLESRLVNSLIKIDLPMIYNSSITMMFDSVPSYESKLAVSGTVSGVVFSDYRVELYVVTSKEYFWKTADIGTDGKWSFSNSNTGTKQVRLVRKSDNVWIHTLEIPTCVRSHRMTPDTDPATAAIMSDRTYTYDQAIVACAMIAQNHPNVNHYIKGLLAVIGADGSVPFYVNRLSAFKSRNYYRSGNAAWVYYALAYYLKKYPSGAYAAEAAIKLQLGLSWIDRFFISNTNDPRYGLYRGGKGRFTDGGTVFDEDYQVYWCSCEHNLDMWFVLNTAVALGYTEYTARRDLVKNTIVNKLWSATENRLCTGINENGLDTTRYLDTSSWGGLFLLAAGETTKGRDSKAFLDTYKFATIEASGYTPYMEQNRTKGIWVEGSAGAALYERALGNITTNLNIIAKMRALLTPYGYRDSLIDPNDKTLSLWEQSCNTAWVLLAYKPNGFMNVD